MGFNSGFKGLILQNLSHFPIKHSWWGIYELSSLYTSTAQTKLQFCIYKSWRCKLKNWLLSKWLMIKILLFFEIRIYKDLFLKQNIVLSVACFDREMYANIMPGSINTRISTATSRSLAETHARSEASSLIRKLTSTENRRIVLKNFCVWLEGLERGRILSPNIIVVGTILKRKYLSYTVFSTSYN